MSRSGSDEMRRVATTRWTILAFVLTWTLVAAPVSAQEDDVAVVLHPENDRVEMSVRHLRLIYTGYVRQWSNGRSIDLILPPADSPAMTILSERVFRKQTAAEIDRFYLHAIFRERFAKRPVQMSDRDALRYVEVTPGAVALVRRSNIPPDARVRTIDLKVR